MPRDVPNQILPLRSSANASMVTDCSALGPHILSRWKFPVFLSSCAAPASNVPIQRRFLESSKISHTFWLGSEVVSPGILVNLINFLPSNLLRPSLNVPIQRF